MLVEGQPGGYHLAISRPNRRRMSRTRLVMAIRVGAWLVSVVLGLVASASIQAQTPLGIPRELARERAARVSDVRYHLSYTLIAKAAETLGHEEIRFQLKDDRKLGEAKDSGSQGDLKTSPPGAGTPIAPLLLDFREGRVKTFMVNGSRVDANIENGHIELPGSLLKQGENLVAVDFTAPIATAGKAFTRFEDKDDGSEYIYTLFVPMDAEMAFPCFDQPDLKAKFRLSVTAPQDWTVISNSDGKETTHENAGAAGQHRIEFAETKPISTYLFAFAAGPFKKVHDTPGLPGLYVRQSKLQKAEAEAAEVQQITADGI